MTDDPTTPSASPPALPPTDPITAAATTAVASMFEAVFSALTTDIEKLVQQSGASNPLAPPLQTFTSDMIKVLGDRVKQALGSGGQ